MRLLLLLLFLLNYSASAQIVVIEWEDRRCLEWDDFSGSIDENSFKDIAAVSCLKLDYFIEKIVVKGKLFSYYNGTHKVLLNDLLISNGIGFSHNGEKMYFIDSPTKKVDQYKYNLDTGEIIFEKHIVEIDGEGVPDGMCVDLDGNIWVAEWGGRRVCKWDVNTGHMLNEILLPCSRVTSCCLGGENMDELFITTAKNEKNILGGALFRKKLN